MISCTPPTGSHIVYFSHLSFKYIHSTLDCCLNTSVVQVTSGIDRVLLGAVEEDGESSFSGRAAQDQDCQAVTRPRVSDLWYSVRTNLTSVDRTLQQLSTLGPPDLHPVPALDQQQELQGRVQSEENHQTLNQTILHLSTFNW